MNKYNIGDILEAKEDVKLSGWSDSKCAKGETMQIVEVRIKIDHSKNISIEYSLCFPDKAPYIRTDRRENIIGKIFKKISEGNINYCAEWSK